MCGIWKRPAWAEDLRLDDRSKEYCQMSKGTVKAEGRTYQVPEDEVKI
jgi:hypothetical protein